MTLIVPPTYYNMTLYVAFRVMASSFLSGLSALGLFHCIFLSLYCFSQHFYKFFRICYLGLTLKYICFWDTELVPFLDAWTFMLFVWNVWIEERGTFRHLINGRFWSSLDVTWRQNLLAFYLQVWLYLAKLLWLSNLQSHPNLSIPNSSKT